MDIVERLRKRIDPDDPDLWVLDRDRIEAADEIERLRFDHAALRYEVEIADAEIERLRREVKALRVIADGAADEIERLLQARETMGNLWAREKEARHAAEAEIERLRRALERIRDDYNVNHSSKWCQCFAAEALAAQDQPAPSIEEHRRFYEDIAAPIRKGDGA